MKILVTGRGGQVGRELCRSLAVVGDVLAVGSHDCDLKDSAAVRALVRATRPDVIVNPAAYTAVDKAETERDIAAAVNQVGPGTLAEESRRLGCLLIHFSTDYVFDGAKSQPYTENDPPLAKSVYGVTKLAGEEAVRRGCDRHVILRTSWVFSSHGKNFLTTILRAAKERSALQVVNDQIGAPTSAVLLADVVSHVVRDSARSELGFPYGTYHLSASGFTNWHEYALYVTDRARMAGIPLAVAREAIEGVPSTAYPTPAKRPMNSRLDTTKFQDAFQLRLPHWREGVDQVLDALFRGAVNDGF